ICQGISKEIFDQPHYNRVREIAEQATASKKMVYQANDRSEIIKDRKIASFLCLPILTGQTALGFIYAHRESKSRPLTRETLLLIDNFLLQAAVVIENLLLYDSNIRDQLLGIYNIEYFRRRLTEELQRCLRYKKPISLIIIDIDDFKRINAIFDHSGGNAVLKMIVEIIKESIRSTDILARIGGDKLAIILPETDHSAAARVAFRLKEKIEKNQFGFGEKRLNLTVCIGFVACKAEEVKLAEDIIDSAEQALQIAKEKGDGQIASLHKCEVKSDEHLVLIGECPALKNVRAMIDRLTMVDATILITGETGTGKEVVARLIHEKSRRRDKPFIIVNCGAIPENLIESELFGHERGSFTGAYTTQKGKFELAHTGSIFLDEIGELPLHLQPKILRAVEEGKIQRIGGKTPISVDVRIIAATNRNLEASVHEGKFRRDLFYRLNVISIHLPALCERGDDVFLLAKHFMERYSKAYDKPVKEFTPEAHHLLKEYRWPGNVRELAHVIERAVIMDHDGVICPRDLNLRTDFRRIPKLNEIKQEIEKGAITEALRKNYGNISRTSRDLGITRVTLRKRLRSLRIDPADFKTGQ
ncbi:MAG: sigma 54-interacting transcriptional regulator, partial [candidate division WOR-3 bacterium]